MSRCPCIWVALALAVCSSQPVFAAIEDQGPAYEAPAAVPAPVLTRAPVLAAPSEPPYPEALLSEHVAGEAALLIDIDAQGGVERVILQKATRPQFAEAALIAATRLAFTPALIDNLPSGIRIEYTYHFVPPEPEAPPQPEAPVNFAGSVREAGTRLPLPKATISIAGAVVGSTNVEGNFALRGVPPGDLAVRIAVPGFAPYEMIETRAPNERIDVKYYLRREASNPYETVVRGRLEKREVSKIELSRAELEKIPGTFGDPIRVLENLPGMARAPGFGGELLVRGASPQDTQVFMDGVPIPLLYHFFGLTSVVNAGFLERIDFYPGGFGARYGRATAGIVDIVSRDLDCSLWHGSAKVDVIDSAAYTCVPAGTWRVAAAGRRSYVDLWLPAVLNAVARTSDQGVVTVSPVYYDYQAKARAVYGDHAVSIYTFGSDDNLKVLQAGSLELTNFSLGLHQAFQRVQLKDRWRIGPNTRLTSSLSPGYTLQVFQNQVTEQEVSLSLAERLFTIDWREDFTTELIPEFIINAGIDHSFGFTSVDLTIPGTLGRNFPTPAFDYSATQQYSDKPNQFNQGYWGELVVAPDPSFKIIGGLRLENLQLGGAHNFAALPRATVRWEFTQGSTVKAAYGAYNQYSDARYILPSIGNPKLAPELANQFVVGYEQDLPWALNLDLQLYYTARSSLVSASSSVYDTDTGRIPQLWANTGTGQTYGFELLLRRRPQAEGDFYGWVAYTLSHSVRRDVPVGARYFEQLANGAQILTPYPATASQEYLSPFDQTHILTIIGQWTLPKGFECGFRFRLVSGNPTTPQERGRIFADLDADAYVDDLAAVPRNSTRFGTFNQLDVRVDKTFVYDLWKLTAYVEVMNVYNQKNPEAYQYDYRYRQKVAVTLLPIIPVVGVKGEF